MTSLENVVIRQEFWLSRMTAYFEHWLLTRPTDPIKVGSSMQRMLKKHPEIAMPVGLLNRTIVITVYSLINLRFQ